MLLNVAIEKYKAESPLGFHYRLCRADHLPPLPASGHFRDKERSHLAGIPRYARRIFASPSLPWQATNDEMLLTGFTLDVQLRSG